MNTVETKQSGNSAKHARSRKVGHWGEDRAAEYLVRAGFRIEERNYSSRYGEIDIIASDTLFLVFAEVKLRKNDRFAQAGEAVTWTKRKKILLCARQWLVDHPTEKQPRFDVLEIYAPLGSAGPTRIFHLENAFSEEDCFC